MRGGLRLPRAFKMVSTAPLRRRIASFRFALNGLSLVLRTQPNAWFHALATVVVFGAAATLQLPSTDWCWLVIAVAAVWSAESMNTAVEKLADAVHPNPHPLVGQAKDAAAGAVLVVALGAAVVGAIVLGPPLWSLVGR